MNESSGRRRFLRLMLLSGAVVGCRRVASDPAAAPPPIILTATPLVTILVDLRFGLENEAITYRPHPRGCLQTTIQGGVYDGNQTGIENVIVQVWAEDGGPVAQTLTNQAGTFSFDVAEGLDDQTYLIQLVSADGATLLSDVVTAQALPSCDHNLILVNFVATPG